MRNHVPWLLWTAAALVLACGGPTGPGTRSGLTSCDQLRECACDPDLGYDVTSCNLMVDDLEQSYDPPRLCQAYLYSYGCGLPLQVDPSGF